MRKVLASSVLYVLFVTVLDHFVIFNVPYLKYIDFMRFGFELNTLGGTMKLEGLRLFIGVGPFLIFGSLLLFAFVKPKSISALFDSFSMFLQFFLAVLLLNIVGGIAFRVCSLIPYVKDANTVFADLLLFRVYIDFPFIQDFDFKESYINISFANLVGLLLLLSEKYRNALLDVFEVLVGSSEEREG